MDSCRCGDDSTALVLSIWLNLVRFSKQSQMEEATCFRMIPGGELNKKGVADADDCNLISSH